MQHLHDCGGAQFGGLVVRNARGRPLANARAQKAEAAQWTMASNLASVQVCRRYGAKTKYRLVDGENDSMYKYHSACAIRILGTLVAIRQAPPSTGHQRYELDGNREHGWCLAFVLYKHCDARLLHPHAAAALKNIICGRCSKRWPCACSPWADPRSQLLLLTGPFMPNLVALADASTPNAVWQRALLPQRSMKDRS